MYQTHTFVYYNIIDQTNAADAHVVFWSSVDQPPRTRCTYAHTNTHAQSATHVHRELSDNYINYNANGFRHNNIVAFTMIIILFEVCRIYHYGTRNLFTIFAELEMKFIVNSDE